jgi:O-antigen ligase
MALSGTRGALAVPLIGLTTFILLSRRPRIIIIGFSLLATILYLLIFTTIGQSNYTINRMRSAFNSEDASFQYRLKARESYADYLNEKPFGWGLGSAGYWGQRFSGDENTMGGTDGGYVMIHAETGIIGLVLYSSFLFFIMSYALVKLVKMKNSPNRIYLLSLWCSLLGLIIANYGNSVIFQLPESIFVPISFALMWSNFSSQVLEKHSFED